MSQKIISFSVLLLMALLPAANYSYNEPKNIDPSSDIASQVQQIEEVALPIDEYIENPLVNLESGTSYLSSDYSLLAQTLEDRYPELLSVQTIGYSHDGKEIFSVIMTSDVNESMNLEDFNVFRMHYYIEAGVHGRETVNPAILLKQIEDYATDYYKESHIQEFNVKKILETSVFHFVPLVNPDGHDLSKFGPDTIDTEYARDILSSVEDKDYSQWKANIAGVDLNKNFPDYYLDIENGEWVDKWQKYPDSFLSSRPSGEFYPGELPGSEPETASVMDYMEKYDFRSYISYHSRGNVVYYDYIWYPDQYRKKALQMGELTRDITEYGLIPDTGEGSGFSTSYHVALSLKPSLIVETLDYSTVLPSGNKTYVEAYEKTWLLPLYYTEIGMKTGYYPHRLYVDNQYVRDFPNKEYAEAVAKKLGGEIIQDSGIPMLILEEKQLLLTR